MELKDLLNLKPFIEAIEQGKDLECKNITGNYVSVGKDIDAEWLLVDILKNINLYRVKLEPREWYVALNLNGKAVGISENFLNYSRVIKVREVIDEN